VTSAQPGDELLGTGVLVTAVLDALVYGAWLVTLADLYSEWRTTSLAYS
jgi:hypothetical protein